MRKIQIHLGTFDYTVWVVMGDQEAALKFIRYKLEDPDFSPAVFGGRGGFVAHHEGYVPIIWLPREPKTPREIATLAHEALHVTALVMRWAGIDFSEATEEVYTHTLACIVSGTLERLHA